MRAGRRRVPVRSVLDLTMADAQPVHVVYFPEILVLYSLKKPGIPFKLGLHGHFMVGGEKKGNLERTRTARADPTSYL